MTHYTLANLRVQWVSFWLTAGRVHTLIGQHVGLLGPTAVPSFPAVQVRDHEVPEGIVGQFLVDSGVCPLPYQASLQSSLGTTRSQYPS